MTGWTVPGYVEVRQLGRGASGRVVLATHDQTGEHVAIKYLTDAADPAAGRQFRAEARLLAEIDDPHVARLLEYVETDSGAAIVMELVNGVALRAILREHGPTEPEAALVLLKGSLLGLAAAHTRGIVHRDYKPENVLVDQAGHSTLTDFGIAARVGREGQLAGTPRYMAPEQWRVGAATVRTDIYAATATFYECLVGTPPYRADDIESLAQMHAEAPVPTGLLPEELRDLVRRGMAKRPEDRPAGASELLTALETAALGYGPDWEERGKGQLARRVALLALLLPVAGTAAGGSTVANTLLGPGGWLRRVLVGGAAVGLMAGGGAATMGFWPEPASPAGQPLPAPSLTAPASPVPADSPTPTPSPVPTPTPTPSPVGSPEPGGGDPPPAQPPPAQPPSSGGPPPPPPTSPPPPPPVAVTTVDILRMTWVNPCARGCPQVSVLVRVESTKPDPVTLTLVIQGSDGPRTFTSTLSGATAYNVTVPGSGQAPYLRSDACALPRSPLVTATATTTPAAPGPDTETLTCA